MRNELLNSTEIKLKLIVCESLATEGLVCLFLFLDIDGFLLLFIQYY